MSRRVVAVHYGEFTETSDEAMLLQTIEYGLPGCNFEVLTDTPALESLPENCLLVTLGKEAGSFYRGRGFKITESVGTVVRLDRGIDLVPMYSPAYIRKQSSMKGGMSEKAVHQWYTGWETVAKLLDAKRDETTTPDVVILDDVDLILGVLYRALESPRLAYDYETWGDVAALRPELNTKFLIVSVGIAFEGESGNEVYSFPFDDPRMEWLKQHKEEIEAAWKKVVACGGAAHNARYEHKCNIVRFRGSGPLRDTMLRVRTLDELADVGLDKVAVRYGIPWAGYKTDYAEVKNSVLNVPVNDLLFYCGLDALTTLVIDQKVEEQLEEEGLTLTAELDETICADLADMEIAGLHTDEAMIIYMKRELEKDTATALAELRKLPAVKRVEKWASENVKSYRGKDVVFNPKSTPMMHRLVFHELKAKVDLVKNKISLDKKVLQGMVDSYPVLAKVVDVRSAASMQTFLDMWGDYTTGDGCVHTSYNQHIVVTGRLSSTDPPLQNIPKAHKIRKVFSSRFKGGWMINADYAQQEPRLIAGWAGDRVMIDAINGGLDLHQFVGSQIFDVAYEDVDKEQRDTGKKMNLGISYGQTEYGLSAKTKKSVEEARALIEAYNERFKDISRWRLSKHEEALEFGYVTDLFGARRHLPGALDPDKWTRERALRQAGNYPIQRTAFVFTQIAVHELKKELRRRLEGLALCVGQIHDSIILDCHPKHVPEAVDVLVASMLIHNTQPYWEDRGIPLAVDVSIGRDLYEMEPVGRF